ncbi:MAG: 5-formyltetrahydrofolate cyclo-ligase [Caldisericia bacterium]|jgi:5-formyltetrahydrofolate cyclo-ligase|nr:5-formyltetrahydrofolate cyclo-ligase [Caldisericia bacterium]
MKSKEEIRNFVWDKMERENVASFPRPVFGRIPNFVGSDKVCEKIKELNEFKIAKAIFVAPDSPLRRAREIVLEEGKILVVALPHIKDIVEIHERVNIKEASIIRGFEKYGKPLKSKIDLMIEGSVAVDLKGNRIGKGKGYGDKEYEILKNRRFLKESLKIVTIVHECQIFEDFSYLMNERDIKVNYIITNKRIIKTF